MKTMRQRSALSALEVSQHDPRPSILFLRSFADDQTAVSDIPPLPTLLWKTEYRKRLEEVIADVAWNFGPLIALNDPRIELAPLGAAKNTILDEKWRDEILQYFEMCGTIVVVVGRGNNLDWEINEINRRGYGHKIFFVVPPGLAAQGPISELPRWFPDLPPDVQLDGIIGVLAPKFGGLLVFTSKSHDGRAYAEASSIFFSSPRGD